MSTSTAAAIPATSGAARWGQLGLGLICMMAISSPQYVWTLFVKPLGGALGAGPAALQVTFSLLIILQTFFSPFQGWLVDRFGPRKLIGLGGVLTGLSWVLAAYATSLTQLYLTYGVIAGLGTGIVYVGVVGQVVGWFPDRRGFAAGIVAAGYGIGAILTTFPIANSLASVGYQTTLLRFGVVFGVVGLLAALGLKPPPADGDRGRRPGCRDRNDAAIADLLADVRDDDADVHLGADGGVEHGRVRHRVRRRPDDGVGHGGAAAGADHRPFHQRADAAVLRLGVGPPGAREHDVPRLRAGGRGDGRVAGHARRSAGRSRCCRDWCSSAGGRSFRCSPRR